MRRLRQILLLGLLGASCSGYGPEWVSEEAGVSFRLPNDHTWAQIKGPRAEAKLAFQRTDASASIAFIAHEKRPERETLSEEFVRKWENGYYRKGKTVKVSGEFFTFKGRPAYKVISKTTNTEGIATEVIILWLKDNRLYEVLTTKFEGDPLQDSVIKRFVDSTKFLRSSSE